MCYFTIDSVNFDQAGDWECTLYADCEDQEYDREEDFGSNDNDGEGFFGRRRRQVEDRRCKAAGCRNDGYCNNQAAQTVNIGVFSRQDIGALPAQRVYHANAGQEVSLSSTGKVSLGAMPRNGLVVIMTFSLGFCVDLTLCQ